MSQRDVLAELRTAHVEAPPPLRARVRLLAAQAPQPRRSRRRFALVLVPVVAAAIAAGVYFSTRPAHQQQVVHGAVFRATRSVGGATTATPAPSAKRIQRYGASLEVQVKDVANAVIRAQRIAGSLGGFTQSMHLSTAKKQGNAYLVLRVPRSHVQAAVTRLRSLGAVLGEQVDIQDLQAGINATDRLIARLERELKTASKDRATALTARIKALQRQRAATVRTAHFATVSLALSTPAPAPHEHHHYVRDAVPWLGGALAALLLVLALRGAAAMREARLLSRF